MEIRITTKDILSYDGNIQIKKGKLVIVEGHVISTLNKKTTISCMDSEVNNYTKACKITCKKDEILIMDFKSDYHQYYALGKNPHEMYKKIIHMWNRNADSNYNTSNFHKQEYFHDYHALIYKVNTDNCYFDDEYFGPRNNDDEQIEPIGDYMSLYRDSEWHPFRSKDWFNKSMR